MDERQERISWFFDFMQTDFDQLSIEKRHSYSVRLVMFVGAIHSDIKRLVSFERAFRRDDIIASPFDPSFLKKIQLELRRFFNETCDLIKLPNSKRKHDFLKGLPPVEMALELNDSAVFGLVYFPRMENPPDPEAMTINSVLINFALLLDGISPLSIKKCFGCSKYFLNFSRRKKEHCSIHCTWKANSRKHREYLKKHPRLYKAYLKQQRGLMHGVYERKTRDGRENLVIARRPRIK
jgi:hypothetical protein